MARNSNTMSGVSDPGEFGTNAPLVLTTPTNGTLVTGVNVQAVGQAAIKDLAADLYRRRCQANLKTLTAEKKKATAALQDAQTAYAKAVADIAPPETFVIDLKAIVVPLLAFYPDATATDANGTPFVNPKKASRRAKDTDPAAPAAAIVPAADDVKATVELTSTTQYRAVGKVMAGTRQLVVVSRTYDLPDTVPAAAKVVEAAQAEIRRLDAAFINVRDELARAPEVAATAANNMVRKQMELSDEGRDLLKAAREAIDELGDEAGLEPFDKGFGSRTVTTTEAPAQ